MIQLTLEEAGQIREVLGQCPSRIAARAYLFMLEKTAVQDGPPEGAIGANGTPKEQEDAAAEDLGP